MEIHVWSDVACPWCYIGKRNVELALEQFSGADDVTICWRSFELDPDAPSERTMPMRDLLARKYQMSPAQVDATQARITSVASEVGLEYHLDDLRSGNTLDAHRLIHLAASLDLAGAMKERLLRAYFTEGRLLSDHPTLIELAGEVGLNPELVQAMLASDAFVAEVRFDEAQAQSNGFSAVPTFVVDGRYALSGAQPPEMLLKMLKRAASEREASA